MSNIGTRLKQIRKLINKSQKELADELSLTKQAISNIETEKCLPSISLLDKLLVKYNININYVISGVGEAFNSNSNSYKEIRKTLMKEVEKFLDERGIS